MVSSASSTIASSSLKYPTLSASASESAASSARAGSRTRSTGSTPSIQFGSWFRHWLVSRIRAKRGAWSTPSGSGKTWSTACQNAFELVPYRCCSQAMTSRAEGVPGPGWICRSVGIGPQRGCQYPAGRERSEWEAQRMRTVSTYGSRGWSVDPCPEARSRGLPCSGPRRRAKPVRAAAAREAGVVGPEQRRWTLHSP